MVKLITVAVLAILAIGIIVPVHAALVPMSWGFPSMAQENSITNFERAFGTASDIETASVAFPSSTSGILGSAFPTITQTADASQMLSQMSLLDQRQLMSFSYPYMSIGGSPLLPMGLI